MTSLDALLLQIRNCRHCESELPLGPRPILVASATASILIIGQAPGKRVHQSAVPWDDASGRRLRDWMGIREQDFYDRARVALVPMGFCYPGAGKSGDRPPRPECAQLWHDRLIGGLTGVQLTLAIGRFAHAYVLAGQARPTLTATVRNWQQYRPGIIPLPHPSPRNNRWLKNNPWFQRQVLPYLRREVRRLMRES